MSSIDSILSSSGLGVSNAEQASPNELAKDDFMKLMLTQLANQDPFQPMENGEFLTQISQFTATSGIQELQASFDRFAESIQSNQALQASTLVGRSVLVPSEVGLLPESGEMAMSVELPGSTPDLRVQITDQYGQVVQQVRLGPQMAGQTQFIWDGTNMEGQPMPPGYYQVVAAAEVGGEIMQLNTLVHAQVESVTLGQAGQDSTLHLAGLGSVPLSRVREIS